MHLAVLFPRRFLQDTRAFSYLLLLTFNTRIVIHSLLRSSDTVYFIHQLQMHLQIEADTPCFQILDNVALFSSLFSPVLLLVWPFLSIYYKVWPNYSYLFVLKHTFSIMLEVLNSHILIVTSELRYSSKITLHQFGLNLHRDKVNFSFFLRDIQVIWNDVLHD